MRDEMLKRLDEIIATAASVIAGADCGRQAIEDEWPVLRAELVAERCENCAHWAKRTVLGGIRLDLAECGMYENDMYSDDYCSHFAKKESTP